MNRRGFIGGLVGLVAGATTVVATPKTTPTPAIPPTRMQVVLTDERDLASWLKSSEGQRVVKQTLVMNRAELKRSLER